MNSLWVYGECMMNGTWSIAVAEFAEELVYFSQISVLHLGRTGL